MVEAAILQRQAVGDRLGDRLDGEWLARVAHLVDVAIHSDQGDAQPGRIGMGQLGDITGDLAAGGLQEFRVQLFEISLDWG